MALETTALYRKRVRTNRVALVLSVLAMLIGMSFLAWILAVLLYKGFGALSLTLFTASTPAPGSDGGLANAILGSAAMVGAMVPSITDLSVAGMAILTAGWWKKFFSSCSRTRV